MLGQLALVSLFLHATQAASCCLTGTDEQCVKPGWLALAWSAADHTFRLQLDDHMQYNISRYHIQLHWDDSDQTPSEHEDLVILQQHVQIDYDVYRWLAPRDSEQHTVLYYHRNTLACLDDTVRQLITTFRFYTLERRPRQLCAQVYSDQDHAADDRLSSDSEHSSSSTDWGFIPSENLHHFQWQHNDTAFNDTLDSPLEWALDRQARYMAHTIRLAEREKRDTQMIVGIVVFLFVCVWVMAIDHQLWENEDGWYDKEDYELHMA